MYRWRDDAFNSFSRSAAFHTISVDATALDWCVADSDRTGIDGNDGNNTSIVGLGDGIINTVDGKTFGTTNCTVGDAALTRTAKSVSVQTVE